MKKKPHELLHSRHFRSTDDEYKKIKDNWKKNGKGLGMGRFIVKRLTVKCTCGEA